ncbi:LOW QUALITY PROTEIN: hypothetical protein CFC21_033618, partial [Triticum aestivum]
MACSCCAQGVVFNANVIRNSALEDGLAGWAPLGHARSCRCSTRSRRRCPRRPSTTWRTGTGPAAGTFWRPAAGARRTASARRSRLARSSPASPTGWPVGSASATAPPGSTRCASTFAWDGEGEECPLVVEAARCAPRPASGRRSRACSGSRRVRRPAPRCTFRGAPAGVDVKVMDLQVFATDRKARFKKLRKKTDKVRKRDVVLNAGASSAVSGGVDPGDADGHELRVRRVHQPGGDPGAGVRRLLHQALRLGGVRERAQVVPHGGGAGAAQLRRPRRAARLLRPPRQARARHCIFWAVDRMVQKWVKDLPNDQLTAAVQGRLTSLLTRYAGRFPHYDVNNEMLHGTFFQDRLGDDINAFMFKETARLDPGAALFVNDYNVEAAATPTPPRRSTSRRSTRSWRRVPPWAASGCRATSPTRRRDHLRRARQARHHRPARLAHRAGRVRVRRLPPCRGPRGGAPGRRTRTRPWRASCSGGSCRDTCGARTPASSTPTAPSTTPAKGSSTCGRSGRRTRAGRSTATATSSSGGTTARTSCSSRRPRGRCTRPSASRRGTRLSCWTWTC